MDDSLWHRKSHVDNCDLLVGRTCSLIGKQWIVDDPALHRGLLRIVHPASPWLRFFGDRRGNKAQSDCIAAVLLIDDAADELVL